jgi:hypothetical protein
MTIDNSRTNNSNFKGSFLGYFITASSLLLSVCPFFSGSSRNISAGLMVILFIIATMKARSVYNQKVILFMGLTYALIIVQGILWGFSFKAALFFPLLIIYLPFLILTILGISYFKYLFNVLFFAAIYTTIIWTLQIIFPGVDSFLQGLAKAFFLYGGDAWARSIILYTVPGIDSWAYLPDYHVYRNSGIFHEPGAYSIFLIFAIIINTIFTNNPFHKKNIILSAILLTTFSTAGYIMLFTLAIYSAQKYKMQGSLKLLLILMFIPLIIYTYNTSSFLGAKIQTQYATQSDAMKQGEITRGRFFSFISSYKVALNYPITGRSILSATDINEEIGEGGSFGYGFIGLTARFGIIFSAIYLGYLYIGLKRLCMLFQLNKQYALIFFVVMNLGFLSQVFIIIQPIVMIFLTGLIVPKNVLLIKKTKYNYLTGIKLHS